MVERDTKEVLERFNELMTKDPSESWGDIDDMTIKELRLKVTRPGDQLSDPNQKMSIAIVIAIVVVT